MEPVKFIRTSRPPSAAVTSAESAPTGSEGVDCEQFSKCAVTFRALTNVTNYSLLVWVHDGTGWAQAANASNEVINIDTLTTTFSQLFDVSGFERVFVQVDAITAGAGSPSITRQYSLSN
mgnify:CR=1 FL=1